MFSDTPPLNGLYLTIDLHDNKHIYLQQVTGDTFHTIIRTTDTDIGYDPKYYARASGLNISYCFSLLSLLEVPNIKHVTEVEQFNQLLYSVFSMAHKGPLTLSFPATWKEIIHY